MTPLRLKRYHAALSLALSLLLASGSGALAAEPAKMVATTGCMPWGAPSLLIEVSGLAGGAKARAHIWGSGIDAIKIGRPLHLGSLAEGEQAPSSGPGESSLCESSGACEGEPSILSFARSAPDSGEKLSGTIQFKKSITPKPIAIAGVIMDGGACR
jgi:hypothetical protein